MISIDISCSTGVKEDLREGECKTSESEAVVNQSQITRLLALAPLRHPDIDFSPCPLNYDYTLWQYSTSGEPL